MPRPRPQLLTPISEKSSQPIRFKPPFKCSGSEASEILTDKFQALNSSFSQASICSSQSTIVYPHNSPPHVGFEDSAISLNCMPGSAPDLNMLIHDQCNSENTLEELPDDGNEPQGPDGSANFLVEDENYQNVEIEGTGNVRDNNVQQAAVVQEHPLNCCIGLPTITKTYARKAKKRGHKRKADHSEANKGPEKDLVRVREPKGKTKDATEIPVIHKLDKKRRLLAKIKEIAEDIKILKKRYYKLRNRRESIERLTGKRPPVPNPQWERDSTMLVQDDELSAAKPYLKKMRMIGANVGDERHEE